MGPSSSLMSEIADLTYNVVAFSEIMSMVWKRLNDHGKNWRHVYKAMTLMEYLIKTGSERVAQQCRENIYAVQTLKDFQYIDRDGKDQGVNVREKAKQLVTLLKDEERLRVERIHALKTKEKMAQTSSASSAPSAPSIGGSLSVGSQSGGADPEQAWPQSSGEEDLQLQLALAMSKEEAEQEERLRRGDDLRLPRHDHGTRRKHTAIVAQSVPQMLAMMVDLEDDDEWAMADELEDDDFDSNAVAGESALDRIACGLGGKIILPMIKQHIMQMLQNPDWKYRHAGLMALSAIGEGCHQQMEAILQEIVSFVLLFCSDPHPRVRYAACNAIGQMATDFAPTFQKKFHDKVISALLQTMEDQSNPRVQAHAAAALINFTEDCPKSLLIPYLDSLVQHLHVIMVAKLQELIQKGTKLVLEQVVTSIASVADTAEEKFVPYYDLFMPSLKHIVENAVQKELRLLRGKTIECISLIVISESSGCFKTMHIIYFFVCAQNGRCGMSNEFSMYNSEQDGVVQVILQN